MSQASLHIISNRQGVQRCEPCLAGGDTVVLIEDAVLLCRDDSWPGQITVFALEEDLVSRNIPAGACNTVDYLGFVDLCCQHRHCLSW
ncbi:hypothetical protein I6N98_08540 [Spongiibacter nanhainus]|uniref:tRNA 2-thiouridine synthesizing protein B n=1 Tax=Spongiibacter nanhainus TaxID=2794344 RepID=A0A7T4USX0_9GAMM|nr:DsrH/TusB family sulfur metabolism protein [Spongiibacter nanhainus]QQD19865.1 hypothetical protein I6N98_08540 [Spongiibacter nanhainus]